MISAPRFRQQQGRERLAHVPAGLKMRKTWQALMLHGPCA